MSGQEDLLVYPCTFPLKVVGLNTEAFERAVREVLRKHLGDIVIEYEARKSSEGKYLSVTASFAAESREQVEAIYRELKGHELVVMTL
jgi:putative lipoic acid-binding regulatory protein